MPPKKDKENEKLDPPAQTLLEAIIRAWSAGVPASEAVPLLNLALSATGFKAPVWRSAAGALFKAADALDPPGQPPGYQAADAIA